VTLGSLKQEQENRWSEIEELFKQCYEDHPRFIELSTCREAHQKWQELLPEISRNYFELKKIYLIEDFKGADEIASNLDNQLSSLPEFSMDKGSRQNVIDQLNNEINVWNSFANRSIRELEEIRKSIKGYLDEITTWDDFYNKVNRKTTDLNKRIREFKSEISNYQRKYEVYRSYAWASKDAKDLRNYFELASTLKLMEGESPLGLDEGIWDEMNEADNSTGSSEIQENHYGLFSRMFGKNRHTAGERKMKAALISTKKLGSTLIKQRGDLQGLIESLGINMDEFKDQSRNISTSMSDLKHKDCDKLKNLNKDWLETVKKLYEINNNCQHVRSFPSNEELEKLNHSASKKIDLAKKVIEADFLGSEDVDKQAIVNVFRNILLNAWS
jgi:predicted  nucleic acid-binding Zn-ribbon protein